jgi:hypothetical protein
MKTPDWLMVATFAVDQGLSGTPVRIAKTPGQPFCHKVHRPGWMPTAGFWSSKIEQLRFKR